MATSSESVADVEFLVTLDLLQTELAVDIRCFVLLERVGRCFGLPWFVPVFRKSYVYLSILIGKTIDSNGKKIQY